MIRYIYHLADLHIPNSVEQRPYMDMIKKCLAAILKDINKHDKDECRIAISGDIYHNKIKTTNEARQMFHETLNYLNEMAKTIIVAGNHDMLENNHDRIDSISPTFDISGVYPNVTYMDKALNYKSGIIQDDGVIWVLYSIFDKFARPNLDGLRETFPDSKFVGLFHGDITGAVTDVGRMTENGVDTSIFEGLDCVMAGHIHKFQTLKKEGVPIVYSGSVFQQNSGENISGHGFVVWDMETMTYKLHEVKNEYRTLKFKISSYEDVENDIEKIINL